MTARHLLAFQASLGLATEERNECLAVEPMNEFARAGVPKNLKSEERS